MAVEDARLLKSAQPRATLQVIPDMNHVLKRCESVDAREQQSTYTNPELPVVEELLNVIVKFVKP